MPTSIPPGVGQIHPVYNFTQNASGNWVAVSAGQANGLFAPADATGISIVVTSGVTQINTLNSATEYVLLDIKSGDLIVRYDGVDPVSPNGHIIRAGTPTTWNRATVNAARFINPTGAGTHIFVSQFV